MSARMRAISIMSLVATLCAASAALGNGGPFVVKYPNGDPAAKGVFARLTPDLKPAREERLRVVKEDLTITFAPEAPVDGIARWDSPAPPLAIVVAEYTIENPTNESIEVDFGFPILRGFYVAPFSMMPIPDVKVRLNNTQSVHVEIISNSAIYGLIRHEARKLIEKAVADDAELARLVAVVRTTDMVRRRVRKEINRTVGSDAALKEAVRTDAQLSPFAATDTGGPKADHEAARAALAAYLTGPLKWSKADAALMVEFASLDLESPKGYPQDRNRSFRSAPVGDELFNANLGALAAIGEQKATQFFAKLASCFDPDAGSGYESIFTAWGGDVRERSVDLKTGEVRPREITVAEETTEKVATKPGKSRPKTEGELEAYVVIDGPRQHDPTLYARVDYFDESAPITDAEKASCRAILKNLPVIFTFAPMNLLYYRVTFEPKKTQTLVVTYRQYPYRDTRDPSSYQLAYVVHPASLWKDFGAINLKVAVPEGVSFRASLPCRDEGVGDHQIPDALWHPVAAGRYAFHTSTVAEKTGELFLAIDESSWNKAIQDKKALTKVEPQTKR